MKKYLLLIIALLGSLTAKADTWALIGKGYYEDPFWYWSSNSNPVSGNIYIEESLEKPGYYRFKHLLSNPTTEYMYVHCEDKDKVYVSSYTAANTEGTKITVDQICSLNGWSTSYYGKLSNREVTIPGNYFSSKSETATSWSTGSSSRKFVFKLPSEGDASMISGIYFGITAFNHLPKFKNIQLLNESNRLQYRSFVNSQQLDDYTYLYYSVEQALKALTDRTYPKDLNSVAIITFTDGNDDGSLEKAPNTSWTDIDYQRYIGNKIKNTYIQGHKLEAFSIGLKGQDIGDYNYSLFKSNLLALASDADKATEVNNMSEVERTLNAIIDKLQTSWLNKKVQVRINMRGTGDKIRFTLDKTRAAMNNNPDNSDMWIEGVFSRDDLSLNNIVYHGFTSTSGTKVIAKQVTINGKTKYQFTFENLRDQNNNTIQTGEINFWHSNSSTPAWQPHTEFGGDSDVKTEIELTSAAIMLVMDCSSSLGNSDFAKLKEVVNSLVDRLSDKKSGIEDNITADDENTPEEYYNLQGVRVNNPSNGIYIYRKGSIVKKIYVK